MNVLGLKLTLLLALQAFICVDGNSQSSKLYGSYPENNYRFKWSEVPKIKWVSYLTESDGYKANYTIRIAEWKQGQTKEEAVENNDPFYLRTNTPYERTGEFLNVLPSLPSQKLYAWRMEAKTFNDTDTFFTKSEVKFFQSPLLVQAFYYEGFTVTPDTCGTDIDDFWFDGQMGIVLNPVEVTQVKVKAQNLQLDQRAGVFYLSGGAIHFDTTVTYSMEDRGLERIILPPTVFESSRYSLSYSKEMLVSGVCSIDLSPNGIDSFLEFTGALEANIFNHYLLGVVYPTESLDQPIADFNWASMELDTTSYLYISFQYSDLGKTQTFTLYADGAITHDLLISNVDSSKIKLTFKRSRDLKYMDLQADASTRLTLLSSLGLNMSFSALLFDNDDSISLEGFDSNWKGLVIPNPKLSYTGKELIGGLSLDADTFLISNEDGVSFKAFHVFDENKGELSFLPYPNAIDSASYLVLGELDASAQLFGHITVDALSDEGLPMVVQADASHIGIPKVVFQEDTVLLEPPYMLPPSGTTDVSTVLNWVSMGDGVVYELDVSTDDFVTFEGVYNGYSTSDNQVKLDSLQSETVYQYRVRAYELDSLLGQSPSGLFTFTTEEEKVLLLAESYSDEKSFVVYPNPIKDEFSVKTILATGTDLTLNISDLSGKEVLRKRLSISSNKFSVDVSSIPSGIYVLTIDSGNQTFVRKIILE